jgi:LuxR family transcriptional regulator, maltose regulon positive regulatory protein
VSGAIPRSRLHERLTAACREAPLISIVAGAGYGKTTALAGWADDPGDDAAVTWLDAGTADAAPGGLIEVLRGSLDVTTDGHRRIIVLDNLDRIRSPRSFSALDQFLGQSPPELTFVLASRWEPLLTLSRRRLEGRVVEFGPEDLMMQPDEIRLVFEGAAIPLDDDQVRHLVEVTHGWPVAVRLACVAASSGSSPEDLRTSDGRVDAFIGRYLADEVFHRLPSSWQEILESISILDWVHADLAWKVSGSALAPTVLEEVATRTGLFVPVPGSPGWFRPHQLVHAYLRTSLPAQGKRVAGLHDRATRWFIEQGHLAAALFHAIRSRNETTIRTTVERIELLALLCSDEQSIRIAREIAAAPRDSWPNGRPLALAVAVLASADPPAASALVRTIDPAALRSEADERLWALARCKVLRNQARQRDARAALASVSWDEAPPTERVLHDTEFALAGTNDETLQQLTRSAEDALALARCVDAARPVVHLHVALSALALARGEPRAAQEHAHEALNLGPRFGPEMELELAEARVVCDASTLELGEVADHDHFCVITSPWDEPGGPVHLLLGGTTTNLHHRWRSGEATRPLLDRLDRVLGSVALDEVHPTFVFAAAHLELRLAEALQDLRRVQQAACRLPDRTDTNAEARVLRAEEQRVRGDYRKARSELRPVLSGEVRSFWDSTRLLALALDGVLSHLDEAADTWSLQEAVELAHRSGRRGPFIDLGALMYDTLVARRVALPSHGGFVEDLIDDLRQRDPVRLPEPLTGAEIRVLHHLDSMATLEEIASGLHVSRNTVKTHAAAIYRKLEAPSRRAAVSRARRLGLLEANRQSAQEDEPDS